MRKYLLVLMVLISGCSLPVVVEGVDLPQPINLDRPEPKPAFVEPKAAVEAPQEPVVSVPKKPNYRWSQPTGERMDTHLRKTHGVDVSGMTAAQMQQKHDDIHNSEIAAKDEVKRNIIIQYSTSWCGYCKSDIQNIIPKWKAKGWVFATPVDETANPKGVYPRYEIRFADGTVKHHSGSLSTWKN